MPSKLDLQLESGEYFLNERQRKDKKVAEKRAKAAEKATLRKKERQAIYEAPAERDYREDEGAEKKKKKSKKSGNTKAIMHDIEGLKNKLKSKGKK